MVLRRGIGLGALFAVLVAALLGTGGAGAVAPAAEAPPATGHTATIRMVEGRGGLRFAGPETVAVGDELEIVNRTDPRRVGPMTFSLVRRGYLPRTRGARERCFTPGHICWSIAEWQGVHGNGLPTVNPVEAGAEGWDAPGTTSTVGDSWFSGVEADGSFAQEVTARAGTRLWFMDAIHPRVKGTIQVVAPPVPDR